ncbi:MAG: cobalamin-binding protein [Deltaproteobacteria bacterium]|nr:cobalamin-binding protein [Deltaproteobacteria bacterium]MBW2339655.1 cobalamin-binding protein [Deltaproteobacteria bacterium]
MITRFCLRIVLVGVFLSSPLSSHAGVFHDSLGRAVILSSAPMRIISLAPSITEMIYFLGLGDRLVGVTRFSTFPREAQGKPKVGIYTNINIEKVISLNPDLVIGTMDGNRREDVEMLEGVDIPVYVINPRTVGQVLDTLERLGEICGVTDRSERLVLSLRERVLRVERAVRNREKPLVLLVINVRPLMSVNCNTIHHNIIQLAGGRNMTGDQPITYPKLNIEEVIRKGPDVIIISSMERGKEFDKAKQEWFRWSTVPAVSKGKVYLIDSDLIDRPAPRIVSGLEEMARLLHPGVVWDER